jgi:hypothetical protein
MKLDPESVTVLLRYAALGMTVLLKVGYPKIVKAVPGDCILADEGLLNVTSTPALPIAVPAPITTTTSVADEMLHVEAAVPDDGVDPTFALHVMDVMKLLPITVIVLPEYPETGDNDPYVAAPTTVSSALEVSAVAPEPPPLNTTLTFAAPALVPLPTTTCAWLLDKTVHDNAGVELTVAEQACP